MRLREKLMHYTHDLDCGVDLKKEAITSIEHIAQYMDEDELLHHSRPLALAYLALTEDASVPVVHGRLIDAGKAKLALDWNLVGNTADVACRIIDSVPTVDAVPVVRCKGCKHLVAVNVNGKGIPTCRVSGMEVAPDEFCSRGKAWNRRADNG